DLMAPQGMQRGQPGEQRAVRVDHREAVARPHAVQEVVHRGIRLVGGHQVERTAELGENARAYLPGPEVAGQDDEPTPCRQRVLEYLTAGDGDVDRPGVWPPLLHPLRERARHLGEDPIPVPALAQPPSRPVHLTLIPQYGAAL